MNGEEQEKSLSGKGLFPPKYASTLLFPGRKLILSPGKLIQQMKPGKDSIILEVGPGPGFFSVEVAKSIPQGKLVLFDIQQEMLEISGKRLKKKGIENAELVKSDGRTFPFQDDHFDIIFMVTVIGEVEEKEIYLKEFKRVLKENGKIVVSEQRGDPDIIKQEDLEKMFGSHGFITSERFGNRLYYTLIFQNK